MKTLLLISLSLLSLNVFSAEVGVVEKSPCPYILGTGSLEAKPVVIEHNTDAEQAEKEIKSISK